MPTLNFTLVNGVTDFTTYYPESINLSGSEYETTLLQLSTYNSISNIKKNVNNIFRYSSDNRITWKEIFFNVGSYKFEDIWRYKLTNGKQWGLQYDKWYILYRTWTKLCGMKTIRTINHGMYQVNFRGRHSIGKVLGFSAVILKLVITYHRRP